MLKYFFTCIIILLFISCSKRPERLSTDNAKEVKNHINLLTEYEKRNRKEKDTVLLDLVLGSTKTENRKAIQNLKNQGIIFNDGTFNKLVIEDFPNFYFYTTYFDDHLESVLIECYDDNENLNKNLTNLLERKYGDSDIYSFEGANDEVRRQDIYWIKGDLIINKYAELHYSSNIWTMGQFESMYVKIKYSKLSIKEKHDKQNEIKRNKIQEELEREAINQRIIQSDKEDSIAQYF